MSHDDFDFLSKNLEGLDVNNAAQEPSSICVSKPISPRLKEKGVLRTDITEQFRTSVQLLDTGQVVRDQSFTLFQSVGALEIMNRKMDSGYLGPGETMEDDYNFSQELHPEEVIGIIDQLLCHEMAWHMGHPLAQTIFTSVHIDKILWPPPSSVDEVCFDLKAPNMPLMHRVLKAYCLGLLKTCYYVNHRINAEHYFEEEDFVTHTFNRSLLDDIDLPSIIEFLEETVNLIGSCTEDINHTTSLKIRLHFRANFLKAIENANTRELKSKFTIWTDLKSMIPDLKNTVIFGSPAPSAFSEKLQRKLASTVPPRPIVQILADDAFNHLERMCLDISVLIQVLEYFDCHSLLARKPQPSVYVRALLQHYVFAEMIIAGSINMRQLIDESLETTVLPGHLLLDRQNDVIEVPSDFRHKIATQMEVFRSRASSSYLDMLRTLCQNRCRIRRTLCHTVADWDNLQLDAEELDRILQELTGEEPIKDLKVSLDPIWSFPLSSWTYYYKICQMEWIVQLGFELETYQSNELAGMYWYLNYLGNNRSQHIERMKRFMNWSYENAQKNCTITSESHKKFTKAQRFIKFTKMSLTATCSLSDALSSLFTVLGQLSLIESPPQPYSDNYMRYEVRMKPFRAITLPEFIPFEKFIQSLIRPKEQNLETLDLAAKSASEAKKAFENLSKLAPKESFCRGSDESWLKDVQGALKASIFTNITISTVIKAVRASQNGGPPVKLKIEIPKPDSCYHNWWIVPTVSPNRI